MRHGLIALLVCAFAVHAVAQPAAPPPDAAKLALAKRAFDLNNGSQGVSRFLDLGLETAIRNLRAPNDPETRAILTKFVTTTRDQLHSLLPRAVNAAIKVYATQYTTKELTDLIAWGESPSGRSIREKTPAVASATSAQIAPMVNQALPSLLRKTAQGLCADQKCTAKQQQVQAALLKGIPAPAH